MNALILSGPEAIQIAEATRRIEQRNLLHLFGSEMNDVLNISTFHKNRDPRRISDFELREKLQFQHSIRNPKPDFGIGLAYCSGNWFADGRI